MKCPHCNVNLMMAEKQGVEIDYCPECRGIWLDRGELDKIIARSTGSDEYRNNSDHGGHYEKSHKYDQDHYNKHRKKSFLADIFDFG